MVNEVIRLVAEHGPWALPAVVALLGSRSRPGRELGHVIAKEIRWRYLKAKGYTPDELRKIVLSDWQDPASPTSTEKGDR